MSPKAAVLGFVFSAHVPYLFPLAMPLSLCIDVAFVHYAAVIRILGRELKLNLVLDIFRRGNLHLSFLVLVAREPELLVLISENLKRIIFFLFLGVLCH